MFTASKILGVAGSASLDPFEIISGKVTSNSQIRETAASFYDLAMALGAIGLIVSCLYLGIKLFHARSGNERAELKNQIFFKAGIAFILFSLIFWLGLLHNVSKSLV